MRKALAFAAVPLALSLTSCRDTGPLQPTFAAVATSADAASLGWTLLPAGQDPRYYHAMAAGSDGRIYVTGGRGIDNFGEGVASVQVFDPSRNSWSSIASLPDTRWGHVSVRSGSRIYVIGGRGDGDWPTGSGYWYDASADRWVPIAPMPEERALFTAAVGLDGRIFVFGGIVGLTNSLTSFPSSAWVYDPARDSWATIADMPEGLVFTSATTGRDGRIHVIGGYTYPHVLSSAHRVYDPVSNTWSSARSLPAPRAVHTAVTGAGGRIYVVGGHDGLNYLTSVLSYDETSDSWSTEPSMNRERDAFASAVDRDGIIYSSGGEISLNTAERFDSRTSPVATTLDLISSPNPAVEYTAITFKAAVRNGGAPVDATGATVTFRDGSATIGTCVITVESCALNVGLSQGTHIVTASFSGTPGFKPSVSPPLTQVVTSANSAPTAHIGGPYTGAEGSTIAFDASGSSDPDNDALTYDWDFGDGSSATNAGNSPGHKYVDSGDYTVTVTVNDGHGHAASESASVTVANVAPTVSAIANTQIVQGEGHSLSGSFTDPGADTFTASIAYGDGTTASLPLSGNAFASSHTYAAAGTYTVTVTVTDDDGGAGTSAATVTVLSAAGAAAALGNAVGDLLASQAISPQTAGPLTAQLGAASSSLAKGNTNAASNQLNVFIGKVQNAIAHGKILKADGDALIEFAQRVLDSL